MIERIDRLCAELLLPVGGHHYAMLADECEGKK